MRGRLASILWLLIICLVWLVAVAPAAQIKDTESASHGDEAAWPQPIATYKFSGFKLVQMDLAVLSQYSYMVISEGEALVVDPIRDVEAYVKLAQKEGVKIAGVLLTHNNADFVAGHLELAKISGCPVYIGDKAGAGFPHKPLKEGSQLKIGQALIKMLETPGHTPESLSGLLFSASQPDKPVGIITGDALFVGSVGRPDLMGGQMAASTLASMMFDTWTQKLAKLPDEVAIFPAHGAGSLCGAHLSDEPTSTLGAQKTANPYLRHKSRGDFIAAVLEGLPEAPQYFKHNAAMNKKGPPLLEWKAAVSLAKPLSADMIDPGKFYVVDLREATPYAAGHIPNSVNIGLRGRLETWVGIMVPWGSNLVLCGSEAEIKEAAHRLYRVGYDQVQGVALDDWQKAGLQVKSNKLVKPAELYAQMQSNSSPVVVDVRLPSEWMGLRIGTVLNLPLNQLAEQSSKLDPAQPVVAVCNSAYRSSLAVGILERQGFSRATSLDGGSQAWIEAGLPTFGADTGKTAQAATTQAKRTVNLPERISPAALNRLILDLPNTFDLVDIRPAPQFTDYHLPGSQNADIVAVMQNPAYLTGTGPLILVDRDGSLAMAVGGILSQKTKRVIKVLHGGLEAYWQELELKPAGRSSISAPSPGKSAPATPPQAAPAPSAPTPKPTPPKKKSAGC